jgi:DNA-binding CsgD family transcriptional regulator/PAS domain-containing protein
MSLGPFERLLATLYAAPMKPELWNVFMAETARLSGVSKGALIAHDLDDKHHSISAGFGDKVSESRELYESCYCQFDEWTSRFPRFALALGTGRVLRGEEIWPDELLRRSIFYNEFLKRFDTCQMAVIAIGSSGKRFEALSIYRGPNEPPFDREQLAVLEILVPHLQSALAIRRRLLALETRVSDLENALNELDTALVLVNAAGETVFANRKAQQICDRREGLHIYRSRLVALCPAENCRLREIIAMAISAGRSRSLDHGGAVTISRSSGRPLQILAAPFITNDSSTAKVAVAIVFICDPDAKSALPSAALRQLFHLTPAEIRVSLLLADGQSLSAAAETIGVRHETVRSQAKSIFSKTGTRRQGELIKLLRNLPRTNT